VVETHQDHGGEEKACGDDQQKDIAELRNFWYLVDLLVQVPKDIILEPRTKGMMDGCGCFLLRIQALKVG